MSLPSNWPATWGHAPGRERVASRAAVASTDRHASEIGAQVLRRGGNAVDAAVAAAFALAVVNPEAGNLGGGGFLLVRSPKGALLALDFRSQAPGAAHRGMYTQPDVDRAEASVAGHLSAAVPGSVAGLHEAHRKAGSRPWSELVEPAVSLAGGFRVEERFVRSFPPHIVEGLRRFPDSARIFLPDSSGSGPVPPRLGQRFCQPELARTLARIRDRGADGFYRGETAALIVEEMRSGGGIITHEDLESYACVWREPIRSWYGGHAVVSMPPSSSGGIALALAFHIADTLELSKAAWHGVGHIHCLAETWRRAYADRNHHLGDPDFVEVPVSRLIDPEYGRARARTISRAAATPSSEVGPGDPFGPAGEHTTHLSIVDAMGGAASLTTTLNTWYGSKLTVPGAGFLLNNEMDDFAVEPGVPNAFDLIQGEANAIEPRKRMLSMMTPTIVLTSCGELHMVVGTPGGATIVTTVFQVISNMLDHRMTLAEAVAAPRVHHQHRPDRIACEPGGLGRDVREAVRDLGHGLRVEEEPWGDVQAIQVAPDGSLRAVSDPRRGGVACGF